MHHLVFIEWVNLLKVSIFGHKRFWHKDFNFFIIHNFLLSHLTSHQFLSRHLLLRHEYASSFCKTLDQVSLQRVGGICRKWCYHVDSIVFIIVNFHSTPFKFQIHILIIFLQLRHYLVFIEWVNLLKVAIICHNRV